MLASTDETMTPLQKNLNRLGKYLTVCYLNYCRYYIRCRIIKWPRLA